MTAAPRFTLLLALALLVGAPVVASADPPPWAGGPHGGPPGLQVRPSAAHDGGVVEGKISGIDFQRGTLNLDSPGRGRMTINLMPSTNIEGPQPGYRGITDLSRGTKVQIFTSESNGRFTAQIIRIR